MARKYLRGLQYTTGTNGKDIPIFMKLCYEFWAYCVNGVNPFLTVTAASNTNPIQITTSTPHGLSNNQLIGVYGVQGNTNANGGFLVTVVNPTQFSLNGAVGNATYAGGGTITIPGGMPISPVSGPAGFFEGSSVLAVGNDGVTSSIGNTLTAASSVPFNPATMIGKHVVVWQAGATTGVALTSAGQSLPQSTINVISTTGFPTSGTIFVVTTLGTQLVTYTGTTATSFTGCTGGTGILTANTPISVNQTSTDDSIYKIVAVPSNTQVVLAPFSGGTPDISTLKPNLTSRAALSYRVIDVTAASQLAVASGNYFIGTLSGASTVNTGQSSSQFQFLLRGSSPTFGAFGVIGSPNGSWNGSAFSGSGSNSTMSERLNAQGTNFNGGVVNVNGSVTIIADTDFMFSHVRSSNSNGATGIYYVVTVPQRMYTQAQDPNLLAVLVGGNVLANGTTTDSFSTSFGMVGFDGTTRSHQLMTRNLVGDTANASVGTGYTVGVNLNSSLLYQKLSNQVLMSDALMSVASTAGQYSFARARIRPFKVTSASLPPYFLLGSNGEFIHLVNGIIMPWDGSILPYTLLASGA